MFDEVIDYFDEKMELAGYTQWDNQFIFEDIGNSVVDQVYHLEIDETTGDEANHTSFDFDFPVIIRVWSCPTEAHGSKEAAKQILRTLDQIYDRVLPVEERYRPLIKRIIPSSFIPEALDTDDNDNIIQLNMVFNIKLEMEYREQDPVNN